MSRHPSERAGAPARAVLVLLNLPAPDDRRVWAQAEALRDDGVAVTVVCPAIRGKRPGTARIDSIDIVYFASFEGVGRLGTVFEGAWTTFVSTRAARRALRQPARVRMLQVGNPPDMHFRLLAWARRHGCLTVYDQRDVAPALAGSRPAFQKLEPFFLACERRTVAAADVVVTPSSEQVERLRRRYGREAVVVRTASIVAGERTDGGREAAAQARGAGRTIVLGYLGVIGEQDGVEDLIEAVDMLRGRGVTGFRVVVAGDGPALAGVREQVARRGLGELVQLRGWLGPTQIGPFFDEIDVMAVPDPDIEFNHYCAMNKVTHAMARGIPVVLRPLRENSRLVADSGVVAKDSSLAAFADALEAVIGLSDKERTVIGERLREIFEAELSWETSAARYLEAVSPVRRG